MTETTKINKEKQIVSREKLLEAGVYFGHKKDRWNPKMKPYIATIKKGTHILDIEKTKRTIEFAYNLVKNYAKKGATFVFVGTRKQAKVAIKENALRTNSFYVSERWLGGTLTNSRTIFQRVKRMNYLEKLAENNFENYTKKEGVLFGKELAKLHKNLNGIRNMRFKPTVMIIADPKSDEIAVKEARKLGVKIIGIVDTNNDPTSVDVAIPANDDSLKSINLIITLLGDAIVEAKGGELKYAYKSDDAIKLPEEVRKERNFKKSFRKNPRYKNDRFNPRGNFKNKIVKNETRDTKVEAKKVVKKPEESKTIEKNKIVESKNNLPKVEKVTQKVEVAKLAPKPKPEAKKANTDFSKLKVEELKSLLKEKGLPISGRKAELVERLQGA